MLSTLPPILNSTPLPATDGAVARVAREAHTGFATLMQQQADLRAAVLRSIDGHAAASRPSARATEAAPEPKAPAAATQAHNAQAHTSHTPAAPSNQAAEPAPRSPQEAEPTAPTGVGDRLPARRPASPSGAETGAAERSARPGGKAAATHPIEADLPPTADGSVATPGERSTALALRHRLATRALADAAPVQPGSGTSVAAAAGLATPAHDTVDAETTDATVANMPAAGGPDSSPVPAWLQGQALVTGWRPAPAAAPAPAGTAVPGTAVDAAARGGQGQRPTAEAVSSATAVAATAAAATAAAPTPGLAAATPSPSQGLLPAPTAATQPQGRDARAPTTPMTPASQAAPATGTAAAHNSAGRAAGAAGAASAAGVAGAAPGSGAATTPTRSITLTERTAAAADPRRAAPPDDAPMAVVATPAAPATGTVPATGAAATVDRGAVALVSAGIAGIAQATADRVDGTSGGAPASAGANASVATTATAALSESTTSQRRPAVDQAVAAAVDPLLPPTASATASARAAALSPMLATAIASSAQVAGAGIGTTGPGAATPRTVGETERGAGPGSRLPLAAERRSAADADAPAARARGPFSLRPETEQITLPIAPDLPRAPDGGSRPAAAGGAPAAGAGLALSTTALAAQAAQTEARTNPINTTAGDAVRAAEPGATSMAVPMPLSGSAPAAAPTAGASASAPPVQAESRIAAPLDSPAFAPALGAQISLFARDGVQTVRLQLNPAEMGPITVQIALDGNAARVDFQADLASTREVIQASLPALAGALQEAGMTLAGGGVSQQPSSHQPPPQAGQPGAERRADEHAAGTEPQPLSTLAPVRSRGLVDLVA